MLFNSYEFLLLFLPITVIVYYRLIPHHNEAAILWLVLASLFFYGWWNPLYLLLLVGSIAVNFALGHLLSRSRNSVSETRRRCYLSLGIIINLGLIGYFKYADFFISTVNGIGGFELPLQQVILPLAISFFTFQQIAYLVDAYQGITREYQFSHYALFVTFFPQLIAGPIVHHRDMLPQFMHSTGSRSENLSVGLSILAIGLFKKTVIADGVAQYAAPVFAAAGDGEAVSLFTAWGGALAYTCQLYFDFSGYSDMAIGAARLFGIRLPLNFYSPYKATSIIEFWRRWHMTLSRFLRDYLYIPLGGNRGSSTRRYRNLMITMLLGGLWHGAGWTFVIWGGLHGLYLGINHFWSHWAQHTRLAGLLPGVMTHFLSWLITFVAVVVGWVFFYAESLDTALTVLAGMAGLHGVELPNAIMARLGGLQPLLEGIGVRSYIGGGSQFIFTWLWLGLLLPLTLLMPNTQQIMSRAEPTLEAYHSAPRNEFSPLGWLTQQVAWNLSSTWAMLCGITMALGILAMTRISEFLYFQF